MTAAEELPKEAWTEEELQSLSDDGFVPEMADGELVLGARNNFEHENVCSRLWSALSRFNCVHRLGVLRGSSAGYSMFGYDSRGPDLSFIPQARLLKMGFSPRSRRFFPGAPDLAVEVLSLINTRAEVEARLPALFAGGTQIVWIINPQNQSAEVCDSPTQRKLVAPGGQLDGEHLLPGFRCPIADLFKEWDWE